MDLRSSSPSYPKSFKSSLSRRAARPHPDPPPTPSHAPDLLPHARQSSSSCRRPVRSVTPSTRTVVSPSKFVTHPLAAAAAPLSRVAPSPTSPGDLIIVSLTGSLLLSLPPPKQQVEPTWKVTLVVNKTHVTHLHLHYPDFQIGLSILSFLDDCVFMITPLALFGKPSGVLKNSALISLACLLVFLYFILYGFIFKSTVIGILWKMYYVVILQLGNGNESNLMKLKGTRRQNSYPQLHVGELIILNSS